MHDFPIMGILGFLLLGFLAGVLIYPKVLYWAKSHLNDFRGGKCAHCGREALVTPCHRCRKEVAFCHYFTILGTDLQDRDPIRGRRWVKICTACLTETERGLLEGLLRQ